MTKALANSPMVKPQKFITLDAFRGIAAITVMAYHYSVQGNSWSITHGYLAVDFFFMLSGFVLTFAYQVRLDEGWPTVSFLKARFVRLYPLHFIGLLLGFLLFMLVRRLGVIRVSDSPHILFLCFALGSLFLPVPGIFVGVGSAQFPFNDPSWSLFYEIIANLFHAFFLRRRSWIFLGATLIISGTALFYSVIQIGTINFGTLRSQFYLGFPRVMFSYTMGIMLFQIWRKGWGEKNRNPYLGIALLLVALVAPIGANHAAIYDLAVICLVFPSLILLFTSAHPSPRLRGPFELLGATSYAIYVLHIPAKTLLSAVWKRTLGLQGLSLDTLYVKVIFMFLVIAVALFVDQVYDLPARRFLRERFISQHIRFKSKKPS